MSVLRPLVRGILYRLKRLYGSELTIFIPTTNEIDLETGAMERDYDEIVVKRAIKLPRLTEKDFHYDLTFIAANKNFTYGGLFDSGVQIIIIDGKDLPAGTELTLKCHLEFDGKRQELKAVDRVEGGYGWLLQTQQVK